MTNLHFDLLTNDGEIDFEVPGGRVAEVDAAAVDALVGQRQVVHVQLGRRGDRLEYGPGAEHIGRRPQLGLVHVLAPHVVAETQKPRAWLGVCVHTLAHRGRFAPMEYSLLELCPYSLLLKCSTEVTSACESQNGMAKLHKLFVELVCLATGCIGERNANNYFIFPSIFFYMSMNW